jgi:hypothetical protein
MAAASGIIRRGQAVAAALDIYTRRIEQQPDHRVIALLASVHESSDSHTMACVGIYSRVKQQL